MAAPTPHLRAPREAPLAASQAASFASALFIKSWVDMVMIRAACAGQLSEWLITEASAPVTQNDFNCMSKYENNTKIVSSDHGFLRMIQEQLFAPPGPRRPPSSRAVIHDTVVGALSRNVRRNARRVRQLGRACPDCSSTLQNRGTDPLRS